MPLSNFRVCQISWQEALPIRHTVLWPGKEEAFCKVEGDDSALHYGVRVADRLVCVASLFLNDQRDEIRGELAVELSGQLRKFATLPDYQGQGLGTALLDALLQDARHLQVKTLRLDAREKAVQFYGRFGFKVVGDRFFKEQIPYFRMEKSL